ncbi:hypothetical protein K501DRAFT_338293 [Backusella circina FSU 941]|nr:hypothetical protein K501DRAFT_338293 [Backusella circina FSU 941]
MRGLPMMEGYAFITLDSTLGDLASDGPSLLSTIFNSLSSNRQRVTTPVSSNTNSRSNSNASTPAQQPNTTENHSTSLRTSNLFQRAPFTFSFNHRSDPSSPTGTTTTTNNNNSNPFSLFNNSERASSTVPFPSSVEVRLVRTMGSIRNVRSMLENPAIIQEDASISSTIHNSSTEQLAEIRNRLRESGSTQSEQIGMVLGELAGLMTDMAPRMREIATSLRNTDSALAEEESATSGGGRRVTNMTRIVQGMSLINHFLGSILASADLGTRPTPTTTTPTPPTTRSSTRNRMNGRRSSRSSASGSSAGSSSSTSDNQSSSSKRKASKEEDASVKKTKGNDGKGKSKTD